MAEKKLIIWKDEKIIQISDFPKNIKNSVTIFSNELIWCALEIFHYPTLKNEKKKNHQN